MYEMLAVAIEVNKAERGEREVALGWAGDLARRQGDPFTLIEVADVLLIRGCYEIPAAHRPAAATSAPATCSTWPPRAAPPPRAAAHVDPPGRDDARPGGWPRRSSACCPWAGRASMRPGGRGAPQGRGTGQEAPRGRPEPTRPDPARPPHQAEARDLFVRLTWTATRPRPGRQGAAGGDGRPSEPADRLRRRDRQERLRQAPRGASTSAPAASTATTRSASRPSTTTREARPQRDAGDHHPRGDAPGAGHEGA